MGWLADLPDTHNFAVPFMHLLERSQVTAVRAIDLAKEVRRFDLLLSKYRQRARRVAGCRKYVDLAIGMPFMEATTHKVMRLGAGLQ